MDHSVVKDKWLHWTHALEHLQKTNNPEWKNDGRYLTDGTRFIRIFDGSEHRLSIKDHIIVGVGNNPGMNDNLSVLFGTIDEKLIVRSID